MSEKAEENNDDEPEPDNTPMLKPKLSREEKQRRKEERAKAIQDKKDELEAKKEELEQVKINKQIERANAKIEQERNKAIYDPKLNPVKKRNYIFR